MMCSYILKLNGWCQIMVMVIVLSNNAKIIGARFIAFRKYNICLLEQTMYCLLYTSPSPRDLSTSRMPSSA